MTPVVVVMTTWNRPRLLEQALRSLTAELDAIDSEQIHAVLADDCSNNPTTEAILARAAERKDVTVLRRPARHPTWVHASIADNNLSAFEYVLTQHEPEIIVKLDDDMVLHPGGLTRLLRMFEFAKCSHPDSVLWMSGHRTPLDHDRPLVQGRPWSIDGGSHVCMAYPAGNVRAWLADALNDLEEVRKQGYDWHFYNWRTAKMPHLLPLCLVPSIAYHCGRTGVHLANQDWNIDPPPALTWADSLIVE